MKLTPKRLFCLRALSGDDLASFQISRMARDDGWNQTSTVVEWADAPLRELRNAGLVELTGATHRLGGRIHRITDAGREALKAVSA